MCPETGIWYNSELVPGGLKAASEQRVVFLISRSPGETVKAALVPYAS